jgi:hypothetical protein
MRQDILIQVNKEKGFDFISSPLPEAKDAFIIFDEAYEGNDVDAFYLGESTNQISFIPSLQLTAISKQFEQTIAAKRKTERFRSDVLMFFPYFSQTEKKKEGVVWKELPKTIRTCLITPSQLK